MRRLLSLALCLLLLGSLCLSSGAAEEVESLSSRVQAFMVENGLTQSDFAMGFYNTVTGDSYAYNDETMFPGGDLWRLAVHMYYYEQEAMGAYEPTLEEPDYVFTIGDMTLEDCHYHGIILGDRNVSEKMRLEMGTYQDFKQTVNEAFGHLDVETLPEEFLNDNMFNTRFWLNSLKAVAKEPERFGDLMRNFNLVQTHDGFAAYGKSYSMVHILGQDEDYIWDVAEVSAPQNYILVCCIGQEGGMELLGQLNALVCQYVEDCAKVQPVEAESEEATEETKPIFVASQKPDNSSALLWIGIALGGALVLFGVVLLLFKLLTRKPYDYD